jgi:hypothetical protein
MGREHLRPDGRTRHRSARILDVRMLVYADMAWLGSRIILIEFGAGVLACGGFGLLALAGGGWFAFVGAWLVCISLNYVPLLAEAARLTRQEGGPPAQSALAGWSSTDFGKLRTRQLLILVPFAVVLLYFLQR